MLRQRSSTDIVTYAVHSSSLAVMTKARFVPNPFKGKGNQEKGGSSNKNNSENNTVVENMLKSMPGFDENKFKIFKKLTPEDQVKMMRQAVEKRKTMGSDNSNWMSKLPGMGAMTSMNISMMEKMIDNYEKNLPVKNKETTSSSPHPSTSSSYPQNLPPFGDKGSASVHTTKTVFSNSSGHAAVRNNQTGPTLEDLQKVNLGQEIEELFAELKTMREKRNYYRNELEKKEKIIEANAREHITLSTKETDMRRRLATAEQNMMILNNECMELKAAAHDHKILQQKHIELQNMLAASKRITSDIKETKEIESEIAAKDDVIRGLNRKLQRVRRRDPLLQFSLLIDIIRSSAVKTVSEMKAGKGYHTANVIAGNEDPFNSVVSDEFLQLQEAYNHSLGTAWEACSDQVRQVLLTTCSQYIAVIIGKPYARLDALVTFKRNIDVEINSKIFKDMLAAKNLVVRSLEESADSKGHSANGECRYVISMSPSSNGPLKEKDVVMGPFGYFLAAYISLGFQSAETSGKSSFYRGMFEKNKDIPDKELIGTLFRNMTSVKPFVSDYLARHETRSRVEVTTSRSSSSGGQAANVSETQITMNLYVDGIRLFTSEAQDTRSAMTNKEMAETRLYGEKLALFNRKELANMKFNFAGNVPFVNMTTPDVDALGDMWSEACMRAVKELDSNCQYLDAAVVAALIK
eukprot:Tbor_TRINITY_DN9977_c0_g1::TRINITY_DN9977_c0_g1_i1::g.17694::m.17694